MTPDDKAAEDYSVAVHEVGHFLAALHLGIPADPVVFLHGERPMSNPARGQTIAGECRMASRGTPYQLSVIGWCGILAEAVVGVPKPVLDIGFPLTATTLREVHAVIITNFEKLSFPDQTLIAGYRRHWVSFKAAYKLLRRQKPKLLRLASVKAKPVPTTAPVIAPTTAPPMKQEQIFDRYVPRSYRALILQEHISKLAPDDPDRELYVKALAHLQRDEEPPDEAVSKLPAHTATS